MDLTEHEILDFNLALELLEVIEWEQAQAKLCWAVKDLNVLCSMKVNSRVMGALMHFEIAHEKYVNAHSNIMSAYGSVDSIILEYYHSLIEGMEYCLTE